MTFYRYRIKISELHQKTENETKTQLVPFRGGWRRGYKTCVMIKMGEIHFNFAHVLVVQSLAQKRT